MIFEECQESEIWLFLFSNLVATVSEPGLFIAEEDEEEEEEEPKKLDLDDMEALRQNAAGYGGGT